MRRAAPVLAVLTLALVPSLAAAADAAAPDPAAAAPEDTVESSPLLPKLAWSFEGKAGFRHSDENRFALAFPFDPSQLPPGQSQAFESTVSPGSHFEVSNLSLKLDARWSESLLAHAKVDVIDLYDRNPTSEDKQVDVDELWLRFGREVDPGELPPGAGGYVKVGKFGKFERQDDRHLESYGLVSTAFNRFEDAGLELGVDLGRHLYLKASYTAGNPLFMRDPNALAGDNGTPELLRDPPFNVPRLGSGITILYDAEVEDISVDGRAELGAGLGWRLGSDAGHAVDVLVWGYRRDLADTVHLEGTFYGGDLDLLNGPGDAFSLPIHGRRKQEVGANLWLYLGGFTAFGQYVAQEVAGMDRTGWEGELAWRFELPLVATVGGDQLFPWIAPAVRYSRLEPEFAGGSPAFPAPSLRWFWEKLDAGVRLGVVRGVDLTVEYAANRFEVRGATRENDELLSTLRFRM